MADEVYTEKELGDVSRVDLRKIAVKVLGIANREAAAQRTDDLIKQILEAQGGKKGGKTTSAPKGRPPKAKEPEPEVEEAPAEGEAPRSSKGSENGVGKLIHAVGKGVDDLDKKLDEVLANQAEMERKIFIMSGVVMEIYKLVGEPDELEQLQIDLDKEWEKGDEGND